MKSISVLSALAVIAIAQKSFASQVPSNRLISGRVHGLSTRDGTIEIRLDGLVAARLYSVLSGPEAMANGLKRDEMFSVKSANGIRCFKQIVPAHQNNSYHCGIEIDRDGIQ